MNTTHFLSTASCLATNRFRLLALGLLAIGLMLLLRGGPYVPQLLEIPPQTGEDVSVDVSEAASAAVVRGYGDLPLSFELNQGQTDPQVNVLSRGRGYTLFLTSNEAVLALGMGATPTAEGDGVEPAAPAVLRMQLIGANPEPQVVGLDELPGRINYLIGNDPDKWRTDIRHYARVRYQDIYPGVDLVYYGNQSELEYDFVVAPGADPGAILLDFHGAHQITLDAHGNLVLHIAGGEIIQYAPSIYQEVNGTEKAVSGSYVLRALPGEKGRGGGNYRVGFRVGPYDLTRPLIIDPVLVYSTYLGGSNHETANAITVDAQGQVYVTGWTNSTDFPTENPLQAALPGGGNLDVFVAKLDATGSGLVYATYLGGISNDSGNDIAVDDEGNAYITGRTYSTDFATTTNSFQGSFAGGGAAFVVKLSPTGSALVYSTYLGGNEDEAKGIAVDSSGQAFVTGTTHSHDFPTTEGSFQPAIGNQFGPGDVFVTKFNPAGSALVYSTYLGGVSLEEGNSIAIDAAGHAYVTGSTNSTDFPQPHATQAGPFFRSRFAARGDGLIGGLSSDPTGGYWVLLDSTGEVKVQNLRAGDVVAFTGRPSSFFDNTIFHTLEIAAQGGNLQVALDGSVLTFDQGGSLVTTVSIPDTDLPFDTNPGQDGTAGISFGAQDNRNLIGGQRADNVVVSTFTPLLGQEEATILLSDSFDRPDADRCSLGQADLALGGKGAHFYLPLWPRDGVTDEDPIGADIVSSALQNNGLDYGGVEFTAQPGACSSTTIRGKNLGQDLNIRVDLLVPSFGFHNPIQPELDHSKGIFTQDVFVAKLNPAGSDLVYATYLGGDSGDVGTGIAQDNLGNAYVTGSTGSSNFPTASPLQPASGGPGDVFVAKVNPTGSELIYSTYLGGSGGEDPGKIALDAEGNAYVTGSSGSGSDFPVVAPLQTCGNVDAFVAKLNAAGSALVYSTCLGGTTHFESGAGVAVDGGGNAYVTGVTHSTDFPTKNPFQASLGGIGSKGDAFVAKISSAADPPAVPGLSGWGFGALALALGVALLVFVAARRQAFQGG